MTKLFNMQKLGAVIGSEKTLPKLEVVATTKPTEGNFFS
jgi:hypothetical protein